MCEPLLLLVCTLETRSTNLRVSVYIALGDLMNAPDDLPALLKQLDTLRKQEAELKINLAHMEPVTQPELSALISQHHDLMAELCKLDQDLADVDLDDQEAKLINLRCTVEQLDVERQKLIETQQIDIARLEQRLSDKVSTYKALLQRNS